MATSNHDSRMFFLPRATVVCLFLPACGLLWSRHGGYIFGWVESSTAAQGSASSKREVAEWIKYDDGVSQATPIDRLSGCLLEER